MHIVSIVCCFSDKELKTWWGGGGKWALNGRNPTSDMKVHHIPGRNGKYCFKFGWLCFTGPQVTVPISLMLVGLSKCLVKWRLQAGVAMCFGNSSMHLDNWKFPLLICLYLAAWEKLGQDAVTWTEMLTCILTKPPKTQPTKPPTM